MAGRRKTKKYTLRHCCFGALIDMQYIGEHFSVDQRMETYGNRAGILTAYRPGRRVSRPQIYFDPLIKDPGKRRRFCTNPGELSKTRQGLLRFTTESYAYTFHQIPLLLPHGKRLSLVCDWDLPVLMQDMKTTAAVINFPDPDAKKPWTDISDVFYAEDIYTFRFPDSELRGAERIEQTEKLRTDVCDFVRSTDAEMIVIRCQYDTDVICVRTAAMELSQWLLGMDGE